ncbi:MAG TPA: alkaline phosphatase family protein [Thermoanaerobaculia bacterium]|nr:alkaline phosphatase family protein [Thermoanaerobaculia bacterium]
MILNSSFFIRNFSFSVFFALVLAGCAATTPTPQPVRTPPPAPPPRLTTAHTAQRVILVSFDGLSADHAASAPAFERMTAHATRVIPINPTETSSTHAAILTGLPPEKTGIVSNQFHKPGTPPDQTTRGLATDIEGDTLVDSARNAGKRTGCIEFPFLDSTSPRRTCDFGIAYSPNLTRSRMIHLRHDDFHAEWLPPSWGAPAPRHSSFSPVMRARLEWSVPRHGREDLDLAAYDTTNDNVTNYDTFYVESPRGETRVDAGGWFALSMHTDEGTYGRWSKIVQSDPALGAVTVYIGPVSNALAYPASFRDALESSAGFLPATPDEPSARDWLAGKEGIDPATFSEEADRLAAYLTNATLFAMSHMQFDLLLSYDQILDQTQHQFAHDVDPQRETIRRAYAAFDRSVAALTAAIDPTRDAIVITGDHGYAPIDAEVRIDSLLPAGWRAFVNGNVAHLYRFSGDADVVNALTTLRAPDGSLVFERVERRGPSSHPNAGDVIAYTYPRFALQAGAEPLFTPTTSLGQHGGLNSHPELHTTLGASGAGIPPQRVDVLPQTDVARFVRELMFGPSGAPTGAAPAPR